MGSIIRVVYSLVWCWTMATSHAYNAMQMAHQLHGSSYRRPPNYLSSRSSSPVSNRASESRMRANTFVASGCAELGTEATFRSRVGSVLGDVKRGILRQRPKVEVIEDLSDFDSMIKNTKEQFVAVFFHSPVCKACQAAAPHYYKLSQKFSNVKFLSVPLTPGNKKTLQNDLGVKKFPFGHIYHSEHGLLDELPILRKLVPHFEERLKRHILVGSFEIAQSEEAKARLTEEAANVKEDLCSS